MEERSNAEERDIDMEDKAAREELAINDLVSHCRVSTDNKKTMEEFFKEYTDSPFRNTWCVENQLKKVCPQIPCLFPNCKIWFTAEWKLKRHIQNIHEELYSDSRYKCTVKGCNKILNTLQLLNQHFTQKHRKFIFCKLCKRKFKNEDLYDNHMREYEYILKEIKKIMNRS